MAVNTKEIRTDRAKLIVITILAVCIGIARAKSVHEASRPEAMLTAQQVANNAAPICRLLSPEAGPLKQTTEPITLVGPDGHDHEVYVVECETDAGKHVVHTVWDAKTGHLILAARFRAHNVTGQTKPSVSSSPAQVAWRWLRLLDVANLAPRWHVAAPPVLEHNMWKVVLKSDKYRAAVIFDRGTENLVFFTMQPIDQATPLP